MLHITKSAITEPVLLVFATLVLMIIRKSMVAPNWEPCRAGRFYFYEADSIDYAVQLYHSIRHDEDHSKTLLIGGEGKTSYQARSRWGRYMKIPVLRTGELNEFSARTATAHLSIKDRMKPKNMNHFFVISLNLRSGAMDRDRSFRCTPSDCLETFPFPEHLEPPRLRSHRQGILRLPRCPHGPNDDGMPKTYNRASMTPMMTIPASPSSGASTPPWTVPSSLPTAGAKTKGPAGKRISFARGQQGAIESSQNWEVL